MDLAPGLTTHSIVVCCEKRERGLKIQAILSKTGYKVIVAFSLYEALRYVSQEMPHLVITESLLSDGNAGTLYDRLKQHETLCNTPILVHCVNKSREEVQPLAQRQFSGFFLGKFDPQAFYAKVKDIIEAHSQVSPHFIPAEKMQVEDAIDLSIEASLIGRMRENLVCRTDVQVDNRTQLRVRVDHEKDQAILNSASNLELNGEIFNLFPLNKIAGRGRKWVMKLPDISKGEGIATKHMDQNRKVMMVMENKDYLAGYSLVLKGFNIEVVDGGDVTSAAKKVFANPLEFGCIYIHEFENVTVERTFHNTYCRIDPKMRPPVLAGLIDRKLPPTSDFIAVYRPFGLGRLIEFFEASFMRADQVAKVASRSGPNAQKGMPATFVGEAKLVGIDETGGVLQSKYPLKANSRMDITNNFLQSCWSGNKNVMIGKSGQVPSEPSEYHVRFEAVAAGTSKVKYWDAVFGQIKTAAPHLFVEDEPEPPAEESQDLEGMSFDADELGADVDLGDLEDPDLDSDLSDIDLQDVDMDDPEMQAMMAEENALDADLDDDDEDDFEIDMENVG